MCVPDSALAVDATTSGVGGRRGAIRDGGSAELTERPASRGGTCGFAGGGAAAAAPPPPEQHQQNNKTTNQNGTESVPKRNTSHCTSISPVVTRYIRDGGGGRGFGGGGLILLPPAEVGDVPSSAAPVFEPINAECDRLCACTDHHKHQSALTHTAQAEVEQRLRLPYHSFIQSINSAPAARDNHTSQTKMFSTYHACFSFFGCVIDDVGQKQTDLSLICS